MSAVETSPRVQERPSTGTNQCSCRDRTETWGPFLAGQNLSRGCRTAGPHLPRGRALWAGTEFSLECDKSQAQGNT